ncbi:MAG: hypothetical protein ACXWID_06540 [Pyrinomonadaceae bacterium]
MLNQLARYRVHLIFGAATVFWFALGTIAGIVDGDGVFHSFWTSIKEVKPMEWVSGICMWVAIASLVKQNDELRARIEVLASRQ